MTTPQTENGFTRTANELMEAESKVRMSGTQWQVYNAVKRLTYGWNKKEDRIAYSQLEEATGLRKNQVFDAIQSLIKRRILLSRKTGTHSPQVLGIQKDHERWKLYREKGTPRKIGTGSTEKLVHDYPEKPGPPKTVKTLKEKDDPLYFFSEFPDRFKDSTEFKEVWPLWVAHRKEKGTPLHELKTGAKASMDKLTKYSPKIAAIAITESVENGWTGVFPEKVNGADKPSGQTRLQPTYLGGL